MKKILAALLLSALFINTAYSESFSPEKIIEKVLQHYPSVRAAALQVEYTRQENQRIESQLSWQLKANGGYRHDFSIFGSPNDRIEMDAGLTRQLSSGERLGVSAAYSRDKSTVPISPFYPNPASNTNIELNLRVPLQKGRDNIEFIQSKTAAHLSEQLSQWQLRALLDQLGTQVIDLYYRYAATKARLHNSIESIERSKKLKKYLQNRTDLGLSEDKDILQVNAQIQSQQAQVLSIVIQIKQQMIALNRLMSREWSKNIELSKSENKLKKYSFDALYQKILNINSSIKQAENQIKISESKILIQRDKRKNQLDLVFFIGDKKLSGGIQTGYLNENEIIGGARIEFNRGLDLSGFDAQIYQAQLQRDIALQNKKQIMEDLKYNLATLLSQIETGESALKALTQSVLAQQKKLAEAEQRYKDGRADTNQLIQFENELSSAILSKDLQFLELQRTQKNIALLEGLLWDEIKIPVFDELIGQEK